MGKKKQTSQLGKSLLRDRFSGKSKRDGDSFLHTSEVQDGYDWARLNLQSVTEENSLEEFLATAQLAGTEFTAEKLNVSFVNPEKHSGLPSKDELKSVLQAQEENRELLKVPRRPEWDKTTSSDELDLMERESFLEWRRKLAELQDKEHIVMTPFEKNLEFWRQLWRVIERSDVIVQIVDARNPLLYRCQDLEAYIQEVDPNKTSMILVNKADYLTMEQRKSWVEYFDSCNVQVAFWSAVMENDRLLAAAKAEDETPEINSDDDSENSSEEDEESDASDENLPSSNLVNPDDNAKFVEDKNKAAFTPEPLPTTSSSANESSNETNTTCANCEPKECRLSGDAGAKSDITKEGDEIIRNNPEILNGEELLEMFKKVHRGTRYNSEYNTIGLVGYPNVGKSSTLNALLQTKKVPVSATPGRTKHFQTLFVEKDLMLCDCPGLVMPSFATTKAHMVVCGILPIDQMRDYIPPTSLLCQLIPKAVLEGTYGILLPKPLEGQDPNRPPTAHELLTSYGYMKGYMSHKGIPDMPRSARCILKDFVNGKLLYCWPPPGMDEKLFKPTSEIATRPTKGPSQPIQKLAKGAKGPGMKQDLDSQFFKRVEAGVGSKGVHGAQMYGGKQSEGSKAASVDSLTGKPWKRHNNKKSKEKLRRLHAHLDNHN